MSLIYLEYDFTVTPLQPGTEILIAELGMEGFESFVETDTGVLAYIQKADWHEDILDEVQILNSFEFQINYSFKEIAQTNWNEEWEKNFNPIEVDGLCMVRAPFHPKSDLPYDIVIEPKMSFGTGHHETTHMMLQFVLQDEWTGKKVLDMGCGTAVLAILAEMKGAKLIDAIDIDHWCYLNAKENAERNQCQNITVHEGDATLLKGKRYDRIIANINRNILLADMDTYADCLETGGTLYLSGFYIEDLPLIKESCDANGLKYSSHLQQNNWVAAKFVKS
jgi:ribosomal protein L11 methyltransferase